MTQHGEVFYNSISITTLTGVYNNYTILWAIKFTKVRRFSLVAPYEPIKTTTNCNFFLRLNVQPQKKTLSKCRGETRIFDIQNAYRPGIPPKRFVQRSFDAEQYGVPSQLCWDI